MENDINGKIIENAFSNNKHGIEITLFRHKIILTYEEANKLYEILKNGVHELVFNKDLNK